MTDRQRNVFAGFAAIIVIALLSFPISTVHAAGAGDLSAPNVVRQTNELRATRGLGGLNLHPLLMKAAQAKADDMAARGYIAHRSPEGRMPWDWIADSGYEFQAAAENLAVGYPTDAEVIAAWMESEGHRHNLLNQAFIDVGIGIARGTYKGQDSVFVVEMFARPRASRVRPALAATPMPLDLLPPPCVALDAVDLAFDPVGLVALPLEASPLPLGLSELPPALSPSTWAAAPVPPTI